MVSIGPNSQSGNLTHMFDFVDLRGQRAKAPIEPNSLMGVINNTSKFSFFKYIIEKAMMCDILSSSQADFTIFVPDNSAFLEKDIEDMDVSLARHIVRASTLDRKISSELLEDSVVSYFTTKDPSNRLLIRNFNGDTFLNDYAKIIYKDIITSNGIIHVVDTLIIPEYLG
jgi:uncharacterized surface protein with fasciclin (FAS1) repeats